MAPKSSSSNTSDSTRATVPALAAPSAQAAGSTVPAAPKAARKRAKPKLEAAPGKPAYRTFVLDTSVLLSDPKAIERFHEHEVVLPVVVVTELEGKRHHPELGFFARSALRALDDLRIKHGRLDSPVPIGDDGGTLRVELNHTDPMSLPAGFRLGDNDTRILSVARNLANEGHDVCVISKDLPMRVKASAVGLDADEYRHEQSVDSGWTGMAELDVTVEEMDHLYEFGRLENPDAAELPCHTGLSCSARGEAVWVASAPTSRFGSSGATATPSACTAAAPSSGSPSTSCSTPTWASSPSAVAPAPASPRSRSAPGSRASWSVGSSVGSSSSVRCMPWAGRSSGTSPGARTRR